MKRFLSLGISMMLVLMFFLSNTAIAGEKVQLCHSPPGNPGNWHTIIVSENAVQAHLSHGDLQGACDDPSNCSTVCDDGNPCTVDECDFVNGGCKNTQPVDCDDGRTCTADYCDTSSGCRNIESCEGFGECGYVSGDCVECPQHIREQITMVFATLIAQKHMIPPDWPGVPGEGVGRWGVLDYTCVWNDSDSLTFWVKAQASRIQGWWEQQIPIMDSMNAEIAFDLYKDSGQDIAFSTGLIGNNFSTKIAEWCLGQTCYEQLPKDLSHVCATWAEREIRAITGSQCDIFP